MKLTEQFRIKLESRPIKCDYVNCKRKFVPSGKKIFCSDNCRKAQNKLKKASDSVVLSADDKPSAIHVCLLKGCNASLANSRQKYCCEHHRKKASNQRLIADRRDYDRERDTKVGILAVKLAKVYYSKSNGDSRIRFIEGLIDIAFDPSDQYHSIIRRMMRSKKWREPDLADLSMFHDADTCNLTISEIIQNYCISFYGGNVFQILNEEKRPSPPTSLKYMTTLDARSNSKTKCESNNIIQLQSNKTAFRAGKPDFDDEEPTPTPSQFQAALAGIEKYFKADRRID